MGRNECEIEHKRNTNDYGYFEVQIWMGWVNVTATTKCLDMDTPPLTEAGGNLLQKSDNVIAYP